MIDLNTGIWDEYIGSSSTIANDTNPHKFDAGLSGALKVFLKEQETIVDFGCGNADYAKELYNEGKKVDAFDGNPHTPEMTGGFASVLDLSIEFDLGKKYECVISLEVGEHIPKNKEQIYLNNLVSHTEQCVILSWALPNQGGKGHVNERPNEYIIEEMNKRGFKHFEEASEYLRNSSVLWWFKKTIMVFVLK